MMRILFINQTRMGGGGATIAADRLASGLVELGHKVQWLVKELGPDATASTDAEVIATTPLDRALARLTRGRLTISPLRRQTYQLARHPRFAEADVVHLHNLHPDYFNYLALAQLSQAKPMIWTLHDMWPLTGHCAFSLDCQRWRSGCGACPHLGVYPGLKHDWTATEWRLKQRALAQSRIHIHTPSQWLADCAQSGIASHLPSTVDPYGLDTDRYSPGDSQAARAQIGLDPSRLTFLLASANLNDPRKPQALLCEALNRAEQARPGQFQVLSLGSGDLRSQLANTIPVHSLGHVSRDEDKVRAYRAADALLFASHGDNLPLVIQESLACGTPVIANKVGGVPEMVLPNQTGWLTDSLSVEAYQQAIEQALTSLESLKTMREGARAFAKKHFSLADHAARISQLHQQIHAQFQA